MTTLLTIECKQKTSKGVPLGLEGKVTIPGLKTTKLARKDGTTLFATTSALKSTGRALGKRLGQQVEFTLRFLFNGLKTIPFRWWPAQVSLVNPGTPKFACLLHSKQFFDATST